MTNPKAERSEVSIGFRDPHFNSSQYEKYADLYMQENTAGTKGGKTPTDRVRRFSHLLSPGYTVFEIGPGPGHDALELVKTGYKYLGGDVTNAFVRRLRSMGLDAINFDARTDSLPEGMNAIYAHISAPIHIRPKDFAILLNEARRKLNPPRAFFISIINGYGHERTKRTGRFPRDFIYYPPERYKQLLLQEGAELDFMESVTADNETPTIHAGGRFREQPAKNSYGSRKAHPFGDVYWSMNSLYRGSLIPDLIDAQEAEGLIKNDAKRFLKAAEKILRGSMHGVHSELAMEINKEWAGALAGIDIETIMAHTKEFLAKRPRILTEAALAVCNNNGFSNTILGYEPSWLIETVAKHLGVDKIYANVWSTDTNLHFGGKVLGNVYYTGSADPKEALRRQKNRLLSWFGSNHKRISIGVGYSKIDTGFMSITDYPIFSATSDDLYYSRFVLKKGAFTDDKGMAIHADGRPWLRWAIKDKDVQLVQYLNMVTSGRFPVQPAADFEGPLWQSPVNILNETFYRENKIPVQIVA